MSLDACAALVEKGDPDRWLTVLAAPLGARRRLLPIYAFNVEVSRAPWVTAEPLIAQMRLQWWSDALAEISAGGAVRRHEVTEELVEILDQESSEILRRLVEARARDAWNTPFDDMAALRSYLEATGAGLMWTAARCLGARSDAQEAVMAYGRASAAASWLAAVPALAAMGKHTVPNDARNATRELAQWGIKEAALARRLKRNVPKSANPALLAGWMAEPILKFAAANPDQVLAGQLRFSEARRKARLVRLHHLGGW